MKTKINKWGKIIESAGGNIQGFQMLNFEVN